ncbi:plasmid-related protein [Bordetella genomosp. 1]|uniref:Plasmid-related protein n=1 Tax=Bordetella genomosp. 1 TaxID=1395607 RepID=A0A261RVI8_9BORD|nr:hypothetical protein [Bordetella genomosp. 1]OZI28911.1 plasmid-related protein [Bordetella genomosp. 1]
MTTEEFLFKQFGSALLTLPQLAQLLNRSPAGLRITLAGNSELARKLRPARRKLGRRVYYSTADLSRVLNDPDSFGDPDGRH